MYVARTKITDLEAQFAELKGKIEDRQTDRERVEAEFKAQVSNKDKDLAAKDVESLEIDLKAEKVKAATAEEVKQKAEEALDMSTLPST
ncbi:hypothetical protein Hdeb2414_s0017g00508401 [Helianthus debilis subsp. tardiflorus]